jgi:uncharacterized protein (TIGR02600 family)
MAYRLRRQGFALITVVSLLSVLILLVVAVLQIAQAERQAAATHRTATSTAQLVDLSSALLVSQLRSATQGLGSTSTWASQPGMIRVFSNTGTAPATGRTPLARAHKLYSSPQMVEPASFNPAAEAASLVGWPSSPGLFTDINQGVPIARQGAEIVRDYPIFDPSLAAAIDGFDLATVPGINDAPLQGGTSAAAMPVSWLYVLEDGTVIAPSSQSDDMVSFGAAAPSADNPIVGRIAFWADDESCKVNVNTASEGSFWDTPRTIGHTDAYLFADRQPVRNEFQRYPGHPATVSLSPLWRDLFGIDPATYFALSPRYQDGGSQGGTIAVTGTTQAMPIASERLYASPHELWFKPDRSPTFDGTPPFPDLALGSPAANAAAARRLLSRSALFTAHSSSPETNLFNLPRLSIWPVNHRTQDRNVLDHLLAFCAQAGPHPFYFQRARPHNLSSPAAPSSYGSSQHPREDWAVGRNRQLYTHLQELTSAEIPGFGRTFAAKYPADRDQILTSIFDLIRSGLNTYNFHQSATADAYRTQADARGYAYSPPRQVSGLGAVFGESQVIPLSIGQTKGLGRCATITEACLLIYPTATTVARPGTPDIVARSHPNGQDRWAFSARSYRAVLLLEFFNPGVGFPNTSPYLEITVSGLDQFSLAGQNLDFPPDARLISHTPIGYGPGSDGPGNVGPGHATAHAGLFQPFYRSPSNGSTTSSHRDFTSTDPLTGYAWHSRSDIPLAPGTAPLAFNGGSLSVTIRNHDGSEMVQQLSLEFPPTSLPRPFAFVRNAPLASDPAPASVDLDPMELSLPQRFRDGSRWLFRNLIRPGDVARSVEVRADGPTRGDFRMVAGLRQVPPSYFSPGGVSQADYFNPQLRFVHGLRNSNYWQYWGQFASEPSAESGWIAIDNEGETGSPANHPLFRASSYRVSGSLIPEVGFAPFNSGTPHQMYRDAVPVIGRGATAALRLDGRLGDFDTGMGNIEDGPYFNKPDEATVGEVRTSWGGYGNWGGYYSRSFSWIDARAIAQAPNRQIASPVGFGSLPSGLLSGRPWETLLFCPNPAGRTSPANAQPTQADHTGFALPRDHLLLDLFWMPVVQPYALSEPFSTSGKVNMNYEMMPHRHISRRTGLHSVLHPTWIQAIHPSLATHRGQGGNGCYKGGRDQQFYNSDRFLETRYGISPDPTTGTLAAFERRFASGDVFRSPSEICEVFLVPRHLANEEREDKLPATDPTTGQAVIPARYLGTTPTYDNAMSWWQQHSLTGDNVRETPYSHLYPRLTTRSNTYRLHYRVQVLQKARGTSPASWVEGTDRVAAEERGDLLIERFVDPSQPDFPDFATAALGSITLDDFAQYRIIDRRRFAPRLARD